MKKSSSPSIPILISNASTCWCTTRNRKIVGTKRLVSNKFTQVQAPRKHLSWAFKLVLHKKKKKGEQKRLMLTIGVICGN
ncbi:unnamed protein product, partial [Vitis vinifera]|uniref:Uncharacterized protein n=1 Tax=Vitis vinifera TaxID=29760 RepID=D7U3D0_VITVI